MESIPIATLVDRLNKEDFTNARVSGSFQVFTGEMVETKILSFSGTYDLSRHRLPDWNTMGFLLTDQHVHCRTGYVTFPFSKRADVYLVDELRLVIPITLTPNASLIIDTHDIWYGKPLPPLPE